VAALASDVPALITPSRLVGMPPEQPASSAAATAQEASERDAFMMLFLVSSSEVPIKAPAL
jgi:hypothetical protein